MQYMVKPITTQIHLQNCLQTSSHQSRRWHFPSSASTRLDMKIGHGCTATPCMTSDGSDVTAKEERGEGKRKAVLSINTQKGQATSQTGMEDGQGRTWPHTMSYSMHKKVKGNKQIDDDAFPLGSCTWSTGHVCAWEEKKEEECQWGWSEASVGSKRWSRRTIDFCWYGGKGGNLVINIEWSKEYWIMYCWTWNHKTIISNQLLI